MAIRGFTESRPREFHTGRRAGEAPPNPLDPSIIIASMRDQLGLIVKLKNMPVDFLVVDRVEKVLAGN
jgi:uncharacterized protein (TIGR03435 family)